MPPQKGSKYRANFAHESTSPSCGASQRLPPAHFNSGAQESCDEPFERDGPLIEGGLATVQAQVVKKRRHQMIELSEIAISALQIAKDFCDLLSYSCSQFFEAFDRNRFAFQS